MFGVLFILLTGRSTNNMDTEFKMNLHFISLRCLIEMFKNKCFLKSVSLYARFTPKCSGPLTNLKFNLQKLFLYGMSETRKRVQVLQLIFCTEGPDRLLLTSHV